MVHLHETSLGKRLIITMVMNLIIPVVQIIGGVLAGSMALISDALHNFSDFTSTLIGYIALRLAQRPPTPKLTFGYHRIEVFAAILNTALLCAACLYIGVEGWKRFINPQPVDGHLVIIFASIGFAANMVSVVILHRGAQENLNIRSVFLHMLMDALTSIGVVIIGVIWLFFPLYWLDPVISWVIIVLILYSAWDILKEAFTILMNATPTGVDIMKIRDDMMAIEEIGDVHHIHVWGMSANSIALAAHVVVPDQMLSSVDAIAKNVRKVLLQRHNIDHPILQFETERYEPSGLFCNDDIHDSSQQEDTTA